MAETKKGHRPLVGDGPEGSCEMARLHHPLHVCALTVLLTPAIDIGQEATGMRAVRSEGIGVF
jgi:hypothetical protein